MPVKVFSNSSVIDSGVLAEWASPAAFARNAPRLLGLRDSCSWERPALTADRFPGMWTHNYLGLAVLVDSQAAVAWQNVRPAAQSPARMAGAQT